MTYGLRTDGLRDWGPGPSGISALCGSVCFRDRSSTYTPTRPWFPWYIGIYIYAKENGNCYLGSRV